ncbi:hypothetical protein MUK42_36131 [Musa troglodytarum]|uniref:Uncharacterized protein n=1 Tax=Musa troglodytarum TaxID=320322 RepID=A0A9E7H5V4_9LILI|nr:hypothetical protein MUK42_36131 [Musa troglodytarum]
MRRTRSTPSGKWTGTLPRAPFGILLPIHLPQIFRQMGQPNQVQSLLGLSNAFLPISCKVEATNRASSR